MMIYFFETISRLDPLSLDLDFARSHDWIDNEVAVDKILDYCISQLHEITLDPASAFAALRDLEFLIASKRVFNNNDVIEKNTKLKKILQVLAKSTGTIPRGTVYTYASMNPDGERERLFTQNSIESYFIRSVRESIFVFDEILELLSEINLSNENSIIETFEKITNHLNHLVSNIVAVHKKVPPEFFTYQLRKYFDPIEINGNTLLGPGGAQLPLLVLDYILWGVDANDDRYLKFYSENKVYLLPMYIKIVDQLSEQLHHRSLLSHFKNSPMPKKAIINILQKLKSFRYPHLKIATENFELRNNNDIGSGAYRPDILAHIIDLMTQKLSCAQQTSVMVRSA